MKKWIWIPFAVGLYFITPFLFESYAWISSEPLKIHQIGLLGQVALLFPLLFVLEYVLLYKLVALKQTAALIAFPILMLFISFFIGLLYVNWEGGFLDNTFLVVVAISDLVLFGVGAFFFYKKRTD